MNTDVEKCQDVIRLFPANRLSCKVRGEGAGALLSLFLRCTRPYRRRPKTLPLGHAPLQPQEAGDNAQQALTTPSTDSLEGGFIFAFFSARLCVRSSWVRVLESRSGFLTEFRRAGEEENFDRGGQVVLWCACDLGTPQGHIDLLFVGLAWITPFIFGRWLKRDTGWQSVWRGCTSLILERCLPTVRGAKYNSPSPIY